MIVVERKDIQEIYQNLKKFKKILIAGCGGCVNVYGAGGLKQAEEISVLLESAAESEGGEIETRSAITARQCDKQILKSKLGPLMEDADAVLSLGCGVGVQVIAEAFNDKWVFPANNTRFIGSHDREKDMMYELCSACGECILDRTAGICPVTRCAKGMLNGPCGGQLRGRCEVNPENKCAWILIWKRLKERGEMKIFRELWMPRDRRPSLPPRKLKV
jgi:hypothetical protein